MSLCRFFVLLLAASAFLAQAPKAYSITTIVRTSRALETKMRHAKAGDVIRIAPGRYSGLLSPGVLSTPDGGLHGQPTAPIVFEALYPAQPPVIDGSLLIQSSSWLVLRNLRFRRPIGHNINIYPYPGGKPPHDIVLEGLDFRSLPGLRMLANVKITRSNNVTVRRCRFAGWGDNAIDTIGLWGGLIERSTFTGQPGFAQRTGLQLKGDTRDVVVRRNTFINAGDRVIQIGGGTGMQFFREPPKFEAQRIEAYGNRISGGKACFALATQTGAYIHHNTCYRPKYWIIRLLNENPALEPNQNGRFERNLFVYDSNIQKEFVNLSNTGRVRLRTFTFHHNAYFQVDGDSPWLPNIPVLETERIDQVNPWLIGPWTQWMRIASGNRIFEGVGADYAPSIASLGGMNIPAALPGI